jgi:hypothetical protein
MKSDLQAKYRGWIGYQSTPAQNLLTGFSYLICKLVLPNQFVSTTSSSCVPKKSEEATSDCQAPLHRRRNADERTTLE